MDFYIYQETFLQNLLQKPIGLKNWENSQESWRHQWSSEQKKVVMANTKTPMGFCLLCFCEGKQKFQLARRNQSTLSSHFYKGQKPMMLCPKVHLLLSLTKIPYRILQVILQEFTIPIRIPIGIEFAIGIPIGNPSKIPTGIHSYRKEN